MPSHTKPSSLSEFIQMLREEEEDRLLEVELFWAMEDWNEASDD